MRKQRRQAAIRKNRLLTLALSMGIAIGRVKTARKNGRDVPWLYKEARVNDKVNEKDTKADVPFTGTF